MLKLFANLANFICLEGLSVVKKCKSRLVAFCLLCSIGPVILFQCLEGQDVPCNPNSNNY